MMRAPQVTGLFFAVLVSAIGTVYAHHVRRTLYVELTALERARDALQIEWGQLRLEQSTWAAHERIEGIARGQLGLRVPEAEDLVLVIP